jgi:23S rRNA (adenine2503-C2)-methyltransferase
LIPFNAIPRGRYQPSPPQRIESFRSRLRKKGIDATVRYSRGRNIDAACGQLRQRVEEEAALGDTVSGGAVSE